MDGSVDWKILVVVVGLIVVVVPLEDFIAVEAWLTILRLLMLMLSMRLLCLRKASNSTPSTADATILIASLDTAAVIDGIVTPRLMMVSGTRSLLLAAEGPGAGVENRPGVE
jgi:hypothetical protein